MQGGFVMVAPQNLKCDSQYANSDTFRGAPVIKQIVYGCIGHSLRGWIETFVVWALSTGFCFHGPLPKVLLKNVLQAIRLPQHVAWSMLPGMIQCSKNGFLTIYFHVYFSCQLQQVYYDKMFLALVPSLLALKKNRSISILKDKLFAGIATCYFLPLTCHFFS